MILLAGLRDGGVKLLPLRQAQGELVKAREAGADMLLPYTVGPENGSLALARKALKWAVPMTGPWTLSFPNFIQKAGSAIERSAK